MYLNKVIIIGNITRDPELKSLPSGMKVCNISVATNRVWRDKDNNKQEDVEFHNVVIFGKQAENTATYMSKGNSIMIEGRLQTRSWEKDEVKMYRTEIIADNIQFGNKKTEKDEAGEDKSFEEKVREFEKSTPNIDDDGRELNAEDIPF